MCEKAGASAIAVHPRTRSQQYNGNADWHIIKMVKDAVKIPVIGNGDIKTCFDAKKMLDETGCDAIMIGRGLLGNPWLIKQTIEYLESGKLPEKVAMLEMRMFIAWYLKGLNGSNMIKKKIFECKTYNEIEKILDEYGKENEDEQI